MLMLYGIFFKNKHFPTLLWIPLAFFSIIFFLGFQVDFYPINTVGRLFTAWIGAIVLCMFVSNGLSLRFIILCLALVVIANFVAYAIGYDARSIQLAQADSIYQYAQVKRVTALAGQTNLLVVVVYIFPFSLFLLRKKIGTNSLIGCLALGTVFMILTASRSTIPFNFLLLIFGCLFFIKSPFIKISVTLIGTLVLLLITYIILTIPINTMIENSNFADIGIVNRTLEALRSESGSVEDRFSLATGFSHYFFERPITGYGPAQFEVEVGGGLYAHNNTAELLINYGLLGTLVFYSMYTIILFNIINFPRLNYFLVAPLVFLIASDFVYVTHYDRPLVLLICLLLVTSSMRYRRV